MPVVCQACRKEGVVQWDASCMPGLVQLVRLVRYRKKEWYSEMPVVCQAWCDWYDWCDTEGRSGTVGCQLYARLVGRKEWYSEMPVVCQAWCNWCDWCDWCDTEGRSGTVRCQLYARLVGRKEWYSEMPVVCQAWCNWCDWCDTEKRSGTVGCQLYARLVERVHVCRCEQWCVYSERRLCVCCVHVTWRAHESKQV